MSSTFRAGLALTFLVPLLAGAARLLVLLAGVLVGVRPHDPLVLSGVSLLLAAALLLAYLGGGSRYDRGSGQVDFFDIWG